MGYDSVKCAVWLTLLHGTHLLRVYLQRASPGTQTRQLPEFWSIESYYRAKILRTRTSLEDIQTDLVDEKLTEALYYHLSVNNA